MPLMVQQRILLGCTKREQRYAYVFINKYETFLKHIFITVLLMSYRECAAMKKQRGKDMNKRVYLCHIWDSWKGVFYALKQKVITSEIAFVIPLGAIQSLVRSH